MKQDLKGFLLKKSNLVKPKNNNTDLIPSQSKCRFELPTYIKFIIIFLLLLYEGYSQTENIGMGRSTNPSFPDNSALLDLDVSNMATKRGFLIPRMTEAERDAISNPATGLIIYNTDDNRFNFNAGTPGVPNWIEIVATGYILPFSDISSGTNTSAVMTVGNGASLQPSGTGFIQSNRFVGSGSSTNAIDLNTAEVSGILPIANGGTNASSFIANEFIKYDGSSLVASGFSDASFALSSHIHAITSNTANNWRVFYSNGSGAVTELGLGVAGTVLKSNGVSAAPSWESDNNSGGTVTSVDLSAPSEFSITGNPITTNGTINLGWANQNANLVFASPNAVAGTPSFRTLTDADIPDNLTASGYLPLTGGTMSGNISFSGSETVDGIDISAHAADADAHHSRLHSMASTSDHSAGNWKLFYSNGSGQIQELDFGTSGYLLQSNGVSAAPSWALVSFPSGSSGQTLRHDGSGWTANDLIFNNGTRVGINTTSPSSTVTLDVSGNTRIDGDLEVTGEIDPIALTLIPQATAPTATTGKFYYDAGSNDLKFYNGIGWMSSGSSFWTESGGNLYRVTGNIGIGINNPSYKLDILGALRTGGDGQSGQLRIYSELGVNDYEVIFNPSNSMTSNLTFTLPANYGSSGNVLSTDGSGVLSWVSPSGLPSGTSGQTLRNDGSGWVANSNLFNDGTNVGIGTSTTNEKLTVEGSLSLNELSSSPSSSTGYGKLFVKDSDSQLWFKDDGGTESQLSYEYAVFEERQNAGVDGGTFSNGTWSTRILNTTVSSSGTSITRSNNVITLRAGTYRIVASAPAYRVRHHKIRFRNTTDNTTELLGTTAYSDALDGGVVIEGFTRSYIDGIISINDTKTFELQHRCETTKNNDGYGQGYDLGEQEVYSRVFIQKIR